jgi:beta-lactamase regulating signal transducer with metallopeptidase domain
MTGWVVQTLAASTVLMLGLVVLRPWLHRWAPPQLVYALWLAPALRLMMPALPILAPDIPAAEAVSPAPFSDAASPAIDGAAVFLSLWLGGAAVHLMVQIWRYIRYLHAVRAAVLGAASATGPIPVRISAAVDGPIAAGFLRREIFVPVDFDQRFAPEERRLALAHERMHHSRHDLLANLAALVVLSLHWFNPLARHAHRLFRADQELACDADVVKREAATQRAIYGRTLLKASEGVPALLCPLSDAALLKQRLRQLAAGPRSKARGRMIAILPAAALAILLSAATHAPPPVMGQVAPRIDTVASAARTPMPASQSARLQRQPQRPASRNASIALRFPAAKRPVDQRDLAAHGKAEPAPNSGPGALATEVVAPPELEDPRLQPAAFDDIADRLFPTAADRLANPAYLALRREAGLARGRSRYTAAATDAAAARGRPLIHPPPGG